VSLRIGQLRQNLAERLFQQICKGGERELDLRPGRPAREDAISAFARPVHGVLPEGRLTHSGLALDDEHRRLGRDRVEPTVDRFQLVVATYESWG
jgi:hypothetical protein